MSWPGWKNIPTTKPIAVYVFLFASAMIIWYTWIGKDIPANILYLLGVMVAVGGGGYIGKSFGENMLMQKYGGGYGNGYGGDMYGGNMYGQQQQCNQQQDQQQEGVQDGNAGE